MKSGYIKLHRRIQNHWIWEDPEKLRAFLDLILEAEWEPRKRMKNGKLIHLERGQLVASFRWLGERFCWSKNKAKHFVEMLKTEGMLGQHIDQGISVITICNYESYQGFDPNESDEERDTDGTQSGHPRDTERTVTNHETGHQRDGLIDLESRGCGLDEPQKGTATGRAAIGHVFENPKKRDKYEEVKKEEGEEECAASPAPSKLEAHVDRILRAAKINRSVANLTPEELEEFRRRPFLHQKQFVDQIVAALPGHLAKRKSNAPYAVRFLLQDICDLADGPAGEAKPAIQTFKP